MVGTSKDTANQNHAQNILNAFYSVEPDDNSTHEEKPEGQSKAQGSTDSQNKNNKSNNKSSKKQRIPLDQLNMPQGMKRPQGMFGNVFFYIFLIFGIYILFLSFSESFSTNTEEVPISQVIQLAQDGKVQDITVSGDDLDILLQDGTKYVAKKEATVSFDEVLANNNVDRSKIAGEIKVVQKVAFDQILSILLTVGLPIFILLLIFRQMRSASGDVFSFGRSRAKLFNAENSTVTFDNVAGIEEAKKEMMEIVDFLKQPKKYRDLGARVPKGVLLIGSAGVGKTLLAKAIAGEAGVPFFSVAGSEFMEMLVGVGSSRVRDLFKMARTAQPSIIFIDEIDAIGRQRGMGIGGGHDEREQTLNQILIEMDGFDPRTNVIVLAATNRPDMLDPALVRAGRFDRRISIPMPNLDERKAILEIHMKGKPFADDFDVHKLAKKTVGFSGADLENVLNESAILAAREERKEITNADVDEASLKVTMGPERKTMQDDDDRKLTAYHEAGHAIVGAYVPDMDPVGRVTIVPRGGSLGHTSLPPARDRYGETKTRLLSMIKMMLGGRAAEELIFNEMTTGASNDIEKATDVARGMVVTYGMSSLGPINYDTNSERNWVAKQMGEDRSYSEEMAAKIDYEIKNIIDGCYQDALNLLREHKDQLEAVSMALLERETLDGDEFAEIIGKEPDAS